MRKITWIEINLDNVAHNLNAIRERVGKVKKILAVVKADAYGHNAVVVSKVLVKNGVDMLGVATPDEAIILRKNNIRVPILVLNPILPEHIEDVVKYSLEITVSNLNIAKELSKNRKKNYHIGIHVDIDTGMGGTGVHPDNALTLIKELLLIDSLVIKGIFTHFSSSDEKDKLFTQTQNKIFKSILKQLEDQGIYVPLTHAANSAAILDMPETYFNMVRPGLILYGIFPSSYVSRSVDLRPVMSFKTRIINLKHLNPGSSVGYGGTFKITKPSIIATIPVGYKNGFSRHLSNLGKVLINGQYAPIIGRVCMDRCFIDVTNLVNVNVGNIVVLYGKQGNKTISIESSAVLIRTIPYEIVCKIGKNATKIYIND